MTQKIYSTGYLKIETQNAESIEEYKEEIWGKLEDRRESWKKKINEIAKNYTKQKMADLCGVSRQSVTKWCNGAIPQKREEFIRIGLAAGYNLEEMNDFLERYGRCPKLYPKSLDDSIIIFILEKKNIPSNYESYLKIVRRINEELYGIDNEKSVNIYETSDVLTFILDTDTEEQFIKFIQEKLPIFRCQFSKLHKKIKAYIKINKENGNYNSLSKISAGWSSSLHNCLTEINKECWYPKRDKLISLCINLNMDADQIDEMLETAYMEPLCAKNIFENAIIYAVENAKLEDAFSCDGDNRLSRYVRDIFIQLDIPEIEFFLNEIDG